jgi:AraC-like DNA-binding protein
VSRTHIALLAGFPDVAHFNRSFRRRFDRVPWSQQGVIRAFRMKRAGGCPLRKKFGPCIMRGR